MQTQSPTQSSRPFLQDSILKFIDYCFMMFYIVIKLTLTPISFLISSGLSVFQLFCKVARLGLTFVMTGIQGVQKVLKIGTFADKIHYAVLKQNGQYLKLANKTLQQIFTCQLYDYGIRKFMSTSQLEQDAKVTEIQFWSTVGLNFIQEKFRLKNVSALTNSQQKINRFKNKMKQINLGCTDYSNQNTANANSTGLSQDIFIFFNRSREQQQEHKLQIDMIKVLGYIKKNLNEHGYAVLGNYFTCEGDVGVFEQILDGFGFKIQMKQQITPNIIHSKRVLARIHKNRKCAWLAGKLRQLIIQAFEHNNIVSNTLRKIWKILKQLAGIKTNQFKYNLYILQHSM